MSKKITIKQAKNLLKVDETKLDKYLRFYANEVLYDQDERHPHKEHLTATERDMLERYRRVFALFKVGRTDEMIRAIIEKEYGVEWRQARNILNDAYYLYGIVTSADKEGKRRVSIDRYRTLSVLAEMHNKDFEAAGKLWRLADDLEGLFAAEEAGLDPEKFMHAPTFIFTSNINVLNQRQKELDPDD